MDNFNHIFKNFEIECSNKVRHTAILDVCRKRDYAFDDCADGVTILAYMSPQSIQKFFTEVDEREYELNHTIDVSLTEEQKIVLDKVMGMLADANIGLCHDYKNTCELMAYNNADGNTYACDDTIEDDEIWFDEDEVVGTPYVLPNTRNGKRIYSFYCNGGFATKKN